MNVVQGSGAESLKEALERLVEGIQGDSDLALEAKNEALEHLDYVAEAAGQPAEGRRLSLVKTALERVGVLVTAGGLAEKAWQRLARSSTSSFNERHARQLMAEAA